MFCTKLPITTPQHEKNQRTWTGKNSNSVL